MEMTHTTFNPEFSRLVRTNMRSKIRNLANRFMAIKGSQSVKLAEFRKWLAAEYKRGNPLVVEAQLYYRDGGFTGKQLGPWSSGPYGFWEYDRLNRWLAKCGDLSLRTVNNRLIIETIIFY